MKKILMFLLLSLALVSCQSTEKVRAFNNFCNQIDADILLNLPFSKNELLNKSDFLILFYPDAIEAHGFAGVIAGQKYDESDFMIEFDQIDSKFIKLNVTDTPCYKIIPGDTNIKDSLELKLVPNVNDSLLLPKEFAVGENVFYILSCKKGEYLSPSYKNYFKNNGMEYHGYTIGLIANKAKKSLVYWLLIV